MKSIFADRWVRAVTAPYPTAVLALVLSACTGGSPQDSVDKAKQELESGNAQSAVIHLRAALQGKPVPPEARCLLGKALYKTDEMAVAAIEFTKCLTEGATREAVLPDLARAMLLSGDIQRLTALYATVDLKDKLAHADLKTTLAAAWGALGDRARSEAALNSALEAAPEYPQAQLARARTLAVAAQFEAAEKIVDGVLARDTKIPDAWQMKGELLASVKKDAQGAEAAFRKALELDKKYLRGYAAIVGIRIQASDVKGAKALASEMRALLPQHPQTFFIEAFIAEHEKDLPTAREKVQAVLKVLPDNTSVLQLAGAIEGQLSAFVQAERFYAKALSLDPTLVNARRNVARAQFRLGRPAKSLETLGPLIRPDSTDPEALAFAGQAALAIGDAAAAERLFSRAATIQPANRETRTALALSRLARGDTADALQTLEALSSESPDTYPDLALVSAHLQKLEFDAALLAVDKVAAKQPQGAMQHELRGRVYLTRGDFAGARQAYEKARAIDPKSFTLVTSLTELDLRENKIDQAKVRLQEAAVQHADNPNVHLLLARLLEKQGAPISELRRVIGEAIKLAPTDSAARVLLIDVNLRARQVKDALIAAQGADAAIPNDLGVLDALGRTQALAGDTQQALSTFQRIVSIEPNQARAHTRLAALYREAGNTGAAVASLRRAVEMDPAQAQARSDLVGLLISSKKADQAIQISRDIQQRNPQSEVGYLLEGAARIRMNDQPAAVKALREGALRADNKGEISRQLYRSLVVLKRDREADSVGLDWLKKNPEDSAMHFEVGSTALGRGNLAVAETHLRRCVALRSDHPIALNNLAMTLFRLGKPGALPYARRASELLPDQPAVLDTLALVLTAEKQLPEALRVQKKAVELAPGELGLRLNLAKMALLAGDKVLAKAELDKLAAATARTPLQEAVARLQKEL